MAIIVIEKQAAAPKLLNAQGSEGKIKLAFLDGLRGVAALYVVLFHGWGELAWSQDCAQFCKETTLWWTPLKYGHFAVVMFIAISGYSLMIPVVRSKAKTLNGGFKRFFLNRWMRIAPPYYLSLTAALLVARFVPGMAAPSNMRWDSALPVTTQALISHLLLIHNLSQDWIYKINNPCWSLSTEWEIYFVFALLLVPVWKRFGSLWALCTALILTAVTFSIDKSFRSACPWFITVFAFGMLSAELNFSNALEKRKFAQILPVKVVAIAAMAVVFAVQLFSEKISSYALIWDIVFGLGSSALLIECGKDVACVTNLVKMLSSKPLQFLGSISYSLYLIHFVVFSLLHQILILNFAFQPHITALVIFSVGVPLSIVIAWLMFIGIEKRYFAWRASQTGRLAN